MNNNNKFLCENFDISCLHWSALVIQQIWGMRSNKVEARITRFDWMIKADVNNGNVKDFKQKVI